MFAIQDLYIDYVNQSTESLIQKIKFELSEKIGSGFDSCSAQLDKCIALTEEYTNKHQKSADYRRNEAGAHIRKSGEPYLNHTLRVALILIEENIVESEVIFAAIMHDLYEDTTFTLDLAEKEFGENVAKLIECVTNVSEAQNEWENKFVSAETIDYTNIINRCRNRKIAFYIKFADRLDNLSTLSAMEKEKQVKKIEDTQKYLIPLMDMLGAKRFKSFILDAIFKIEQSFNDFDDYQYLRDKVRRSNAFKSAERTAAHIKKFYCSDKKRASNVKIAYPTSYEISQYLKTNNIPLSNLRQDKILYELFLLTKDSDSPLTLNEVIEDFLRNPAMQDMSIELFMSDGFVFVDEVGNHFLLKVLSPCEYNVQQYGSTERDIPIVPLGSIEDELSDDKILVYTDDMKPKSIVRGSTIIDFAFLLGKETGKFLVGAKINDKIVDEVTTELREHDVIEIITSSEHHPTVRVHWLLHCKTQTAKYALCGYLQEKIDGLIENVDKKRDL